MARYNEILVGRFNRALQKLFGLKGGPVSPQLASEIMPIWEFLNGNENHYLEGVDHFAQAQTIAPAAGNTGALQLLNPAGSNIVAIIETLQVTSAAVELYVITTATPQTAGGTPGNLTTLFSGGNSDGRGRPLSQCIVSVSILNPASLATNWAFPRVQASQIFDIIGTENEEIVLTPGCALRVQTQTAAQASQVTIHWRERFLEESERT